MSVIFLKGNMSKKKKKQEKETTIENFYDLKVEEVDDLVAILKDSSKAADKEVTDNIQEITGEEVKGSSRKKTFDPYRSELFRKIPVWLKAIFIKWWFAGCVCYFIMFGLGMYISSNENLMLLTGAVLGLVVDLFVNPIFHFFEWNKGEYDNFMMFPFPFKKYWTFFANVVYYVLIMFLVSFTYYGLNMLVKIGNEDNYFGIEPLLFGTICVVIDMAFIGIKDLIVFLIKKHKRKKEEEVPTDV